jgi:hypothetical protein
MLTITNETTTIKNALNEIGRKLNDQEKAKIAGPLDQIKQALVNLETLACQS